MISKQEHILNKAEQLFAEKGFDATSIRDIAREAKINIAMVSYYFGSKEKLMEELFRLRMGTGYAYIKEIAGDAGLSLPAKIEKILEGYVCRVKNNKRFYQVVLAEQSTNKNRHVTRLLNTTKENFVQVFEKLLAEGYKQGVFKNKVNPVLFMTTISGVIMQFLLNKQFYIDYCNLKKADTGTDENCFAAISAHIKFLTKSILGYEGEH